MSKPKLTTKQWEVLEKMEAGWELIEDRFRGRKFFMRGPGSQYPTINFRTADCLQYEHRLVEKSEYEGGLRHKLILTESGRNALKARTE